MSSSAVYLDYDQAALDAQYNNQLAAPMFRDHIKRYRELTDLAKSALTCTENIEYGKGVQEQLDIYRPLRSGAPVQVFIHGGAWQQLDKDDSGLAAPAFVGAGAMLVALDFGRVPYVSVDTMVDQVRRAIAWLWQNVQAYGGDRDKIFISGHSSGAHLVSQCLSADWPGQFSSPFDTIKGATFISGLGDLEPVRLSYRNELLKLDARAVERLSLVRQQPAVSCPLLAVYASGDTAEFQRQTREVAEYWLRQHLDADIMEIAGRNHYDVVLDLTDLNSELFRACARQMGLSLALLPSTSKPQSATP